MEHGLETGPSKQEEHAPAEGAKVPYTAVSTGGHINVVCSTQQSGQLIVEENQWSGWAAWMDGSRVTFADHPTWLAVAAPAGEHQFSFRYRPWDVPVGFLAMIIGIAALVDIWRTHPR